MSKKSEFGSKKENKYFTKKQMYKKISKIDLKIKENGMSRDKKRSIKDILVSMNRGQNIAVIGENGSGKSGVVKISLELFNFSKNIWRRTYLLLLFICFFISYPLSEEFSKKIRNKIAVRRNKVITINLWSLFGVKNKDDYPETNIENPDINLMPEKMLTAGILSKSLSFDSDAQKDNKNFLSYQCEFNKSGEMIKNKITHLYIKKMIWGTIANSLQPRHKRVNLEKILKRERYEEGASRRKFLPKTILAIFSCLIILIGAPLIMFYSLPSAGPEWAKVIGSVSVDAPISIIIISFKAWMNSSKQKRINDFLIDQSNNVFISKSLTSKSKFKLHTFHFEDIDRVHEWMGKERLDVIISMLENIKFIHDAENVNVLLETDSELWNSIISEKTNKQKGHIHDYHMKIVESVTKVESVTHDSLSLLVLNKLKNEYQNPAIKEGEGLDLSTPNYNKVDFNDIEKHVTELTKKLMDVKDFKKMSSWRNMNHFIEEIVDFIKVYKPFIVKDGFAQIHNKEDILLDLFYKKHMPSEIMTMSNYPKLRSETNILLRNLLNAYERKRGDLEKELDAKLSLRSKLLKDIEWIKKEIVAKGDNKREMYAESLFNNMETIFKGDFLREYLKYEYEYNQENNLVKHLKIIKEIWVKTSRECSIASESNDFIGILLKIYQFISETIDILNKIMRVFNIDQLKRWLIKNQATIIHILEIGSNINEENLLDFSDVISEQILINYIYTRKVRNKTSKKSFLWKPREEILPRLTNIENEFDEKNIIHFDLREGITKNLKKYISRDRSRVRVYSRNSDEVRRNHASKMETIKDIIKINNFIESKLLKYHMRLKDDIFSEVYSDFQIYKMKFSKMLKQSLNYLSIEERMEKQAILKKVVLVYSLEYPKETWSEELGVKFEEEESVALFREFFRENDKVLVYIENLKDKKSINSIAKKSEPM